MNETNTPQLLTLKEACDLLRVHPNTLRNWEKVGKLQAVRIGSRRDRRFTRQALLQLISSIAQPAM